MWLILRRTIHWAMATVAGIPALALIVYIPVMMFHIIATSQIESVSTPRIEVRYFGDPADAIERIQEQNFTTVERLNNLSQRASLPRLDRLVYTHAPLILDQPGFFSMVNDTPLGVYYRLSESEFQSTRATTISYYLYFSDEDGGTPLKTRMARYGHPFDGELIYRVTLLNDEVMSAEYQAPIHRIVPFEYRGETRPVFAIASPNHNFRLVVREEGPLLAPLPQNHFGANPFHDPDFVALAAREAAVQHGLDISHYVYVAFQNPVYHGPVDVSVRVRDRWYHLHDILGAGLTVQGYHQVGIPVGFTPQPEDLQELRIVVRNVGSESANLDVFAVYVYPQPVVVT